MEESKLDALGQFNHLFEPIKIGPLTIKNRIEMAPTMPMVNAPDGCASREMIDYFKAKAKGGAGIVTVGDSNVDNEYGVTHANGLFLHDDKAIPALCELAEAIKRYGAKASLEMNHAGAQTYPDLIGDRTPIAPSPGHSPFAEMMAGKKVPPAQEMTLEMMEEIIENYGMAALRLKRAGFDMAMIHGAHGWLLAQFLSPHTNKRTDEYGGSLENRARFPIRVLEGIRGKVGSDFALEYRFSADELFSPGVSVEDAVEFAQMIQDKVDCLHVSAGMTNDPASMFAFPRGMPPSYLPYGVNVSLAEKIKQAVKIPVTVVGAMMDLEMADRIIGEGKADLVAMARGLIADPELPAKSYRGREAEIRPCLRCNECFGRVVNKKPIRCAVNPIVGRETEYPYIRLAEQEKKVLVAGGGPGGMQAATVAASRGHQVILYERAEKLGGNLSVAAIPSFKDDMKKYLNYLVDRVTQLSVEVKLNTAATAEAVKAQKPDVLIVAVGAEPLIPDISGITEYSAICAGDLLAGRTDAGDRVVVAGGGLVGCETALFLAHRGKKVVIVEALDDVAMDMNPLSKLQLMVLLEQHGVEIKTGLKLEEVLDQKVMVIDKQRARHVLDADTVVLALGLVPRVKLVNQLKGLAPQEYVIGDCVNARKLMDATREGFEVAVEI